jgi:hypothetical protein|tara:strand:+ start:288 stop:500 length:213 start_codon:yes stop_codon:yes gene_type:complete
MKYLTTEVLTEWLTEWFEFAQSELPLKAKFKRQEDQAYKQIKTLIEQKPTVPYEKESLFPLKIIERKKVR